MIALPETARRKGFAQQSHELFPLKVASSDSSDRYRLERITSEARDYRGVIEEMTKWRNAAVDSFFTQFVATTERTDLWFRNKIENSPDHVFLILRDPFGRAVGHLCVRHDALGRAFEIENVLRGRPGRRGAMTDAVRALCAWLTSGFPKHEIFVRVFGNNEAAIRLYERCGFGEVSRATVYRAQAGEEVSWSETNPEAEPRREIVRMAMPLSEKVERGS